MYKMRICTCVKMFVGKQIFGGLWGRYFVGKQKCY